MNITSKFDLRDRVWPIANRHEHVWVMCEACGGVGTVELKNGPRTCPECYGRKGSNRYQPTKWLIDTSDRYVLPMTIGEVRVEINGKERLEQYMCYETGVGSGTLWNVDNLFASQEEAQAACDARNSSETEVAK